MVDLPGHDLVADRVASTRLPTSVEAAAPTATSWARAVRLSWFAGGEDRLPVWFWALLTGSALGGWGLLACLAWAAVRLALALH
ncbi:hypothetical protein GCM10010170_025660 [Dactylosporangium salmoneum]|uniref:Uncharacterized protein n=2 Tax=Dactylosporangium salmoneum TaxID=53361 RepID=A0ABN3G122_9ACTN